MEMTCHPRLGGGPTKGRAGVIRIICLFSYFIVFIYFLEFKV